MAKGQYIPSPEEVAARLALHEAGHAVPPIVNPVRVEQPVKTPELKQLEKQVKSLERKVEKKRTAAELRMALDLLMEKYDFSPAEKLMELAIKLENDASQVELYTKILQDLMSYTNAKLKSVEMSGEVQHNHTVHIVRYGDDGTIQREKVADVKEVVDVEVAA